MSLYNVPDKNKTNSGAIYSLALQGLILIDSSVENQRTFEKNKHIQLSF